jgi:ribosomal protein S12 methylthiotransferase accessory factor
MATEKYAAVFKGGNRIDIKSGKFTFPTDVPKEPGAPVEAPKPFGLFMASIASCAAFYSLQFLNQRNIPTDGLAVEMIMEQDDKTKMVGKIEINITPPKGLPEKYRESLIIAAEACLVKKHLEHPPEIITRLV